MECNRKWKVLIIAEDAVGLLKTRKELVLALIKLGYSCHVLVPYENACHDLERIGCVVSSCDFDRHGTNPIAELKLIYKYYKHIKYGYDFIITYSIKPNIYGGLASILSNSIYYSNITGMGQALNNPGLIKLIAILLYRISLSRARGVFFENSDNRFSFIKWRICKESNSYAFSGAGINLDEYEYTPKNYNVDDKTTILYIGRLMRDKGLYELCEVANRLSKNGIEVMFELAGDFDDSFKEDFKKSYDSLPNIKYLGYCDDIKKKIAEADAVILPSHHEGMSNALLEAGAIGRPILTSDIPGCREAVDNEKSGFLFKAKDESSLYEAIIKFLNLSVEEKKEMAEKSRKHIEANFDRRIVVETIISIIS